MHPLPHPQALRGGWQLVVKEPSVLLAVRKTGETVQDYAGQNTGISL